jgi:2-haloacid dehalogenase
MARRDGVLAFDVNETLLDLSVLDEPFADVFGDAALRPMWFQTMLQLSFVGGLTGRYVDFTTAQRAALRMVAARTGAELDDATVDRIVGGMERLPPHPEVPGALARLREAGCRQVALTNSPRSVAQAQLRHAGIAEHFADALSADEVRELKPGPKPYRLVADRTGVEIGQVTLVAAHAWDVSGALAAGAQAAFVARPGMVPSPIGDQPQLVVDDIAQLADRLLSEDRSPSR